MEIDYPATETAATPEYVLAVMRDQHRQQCQLDCEADSSIELSFATTVADWRAACDLVACKPLGRALNQEWQIDFSDADWRAVLHPPARRTLADVCQLIARHATRPSIRPATLFGAPCLPAGAFLTLRCMLHRAGADVSDLRPSTPLQRIPEHHVWILLNAIARLAPGAVPTIATHQGTEGLGSWRFYLGFALMLLGGMASLPWLILFGSLQFLYALISGLRIPVRVLPPLAFGELRNFRDMANLLAAQPQIDRV